MAITYSFADNTVYGTEDINDITKSLVGAGVAPFVSKESYNVSDLNALTEALVGAGVQMDGCMCTVHDKETQYMAVLVAQGVVFFENGVRLAIDSDGYMVSVTPNTAGFIYAYYNKALQTADIMFAESLPENGEVVLLAEISAEGELRDKREFAQSKIATLGRNLTYEAKLTERPQYLYEGNSSTGKARYAINEAKVDLSKFRYVLIVSTEIVDRKPKYGGIFDIAAKQFVFSHRRITTYDTVTYNTKYLLSGGNDIEYGFDILDGTLVFYAYCAPNRVPYIHSQFEFNLTFI